MATIKVPPSAPVEDVFSIIAEEAGISISELSSTDDFAELGIDDLLARSIVSHIMATLKLDLSPTAFQDYPTVEELREYLQRTTLQVVKPTKSLSSKPSAKTTSSEPSPRMALTKSPSCKPHKVPSAAPPSPLSILLQNKPTTCKQTIFLLPDGSGSGMAYARIPPLSPSICLIGMNSPFLTTFTTASPCSSNNTASKPAFTLSIEALAPLWIAEIRSRQPHGPYILGGWSAGGYYSFEVAKQLRHEGEEVSKVVLIDSPCRLEFEPLPWEVIDYLAAENLLGNWGKHRTPSWFVDHFAGTIEAVRRYIPTSMEKGRKMPQVYLIWSAGGVLDNLDTAATKLDLSVKVTRFLLEERRDFSLHGWDRLFPGADMLVAKMPGNHFTMVHPPHVAKLGMLLRDVTQDETEKRESDWEMVET